MTLIVTFSACGVTVSGNHCSEMRSGLEHFSPELTTSTQLLSLGYKEEERLFIPPNLTITTCVWGFGRIFQSETTKKEFG